MSELRDNHGRKKVEELREAKIHGEKIAAQKVSAQR
jgi:hypothetical protein